MVHLLPKSNKGDDKHRNVANRRTSKVKKNELKLQAFGHACRFFVDSRSANPDQLLELCYDEMARLEQKFSAYRQDSLVSKINQYAGTGVFVPLDTESRSLIDYVTALWDESKHLYDPTTRLLHNCYDEQGALRATQEQLQGMLTLVGWQYLEVSDQGAHLSRKGMQIDLNSCVRPYAIDTIKKKLVQNGAEHALLEIGRDSATIGKQPDGANWLVGARLPNGNRVSIERLKLNDKGYAMRGDYEQATLVHAERFGRALSPVDGQPIPGLLCVAVIADNCLTACSAASVARLKTEENGIKWLESFGMPWLAVDRNLRCHGPLAPSS